MSTNNHIPNNLITINFFQIFRESILNSIAGICVKSGGAFAIDEGTGVIIVQNNNNMRPTYKLHVRASDGAFSTVALVKVRVERSENSGLAFHKDVYYGSITENSTKIMSVAVVNVLGSALNEHLVFRILNPTDMFSIGTTSGAIKTTGKRFDREEKDSYELIVEVRWLEFSRRGVKFLSSACFVRRRAVTKIESTGRAWRTCS